MNHFAPPESAKVLLLENIHPVAAEAMRRAGYDVETRTGSLSEAELVEALQGVSILGIRSNTKLTEKVLDEAPDLVAVGCFCIGTNQVDLAAADGVEQGAGAVGRDHRDAPKAASRRSASARTLAQNRL